jgi:putative FmdB family regulatory protein
MPVYEYRCSEGHIFERILPVAEYLAPQFCDCGERGQKVILHAPRIFGDYEGYESPATGAWVEGRRAREEDLRRSGCRPYESGEREEMIKRQDANERQLDKVVDTVVDNTLQELTA